jgi:mannose-6-phosphate isomerase-like protein (cupin superfamily)
MIVSRGVVARNSDVAYRPIVTIEGLPIHGDVSMKVLMVGDEMIMLEIRYAKGAGSPVHKHDHESVCYVGKGRVKAMVAGETSILGVGDSCRHPTGLSGRRCCSPVPGTRSRGRSG